MSSIQYRNIPMSDGRGHLAAVIHLPAGTPCACIICCHGMLSTKDSRKFAAVAEALNEAGMAAVRFDFSGNGESSPPAVSELIGSRLQDLNTVVDHVFRQSWLQGNVGLFGSSLGGYLALLVAGKRPEIHATVCWATPYDIARIQAALRDQHELAKRFPPGFLAGDPLDLAECPLPGRVLVIHGQKDEIVPWKSGESIYQRLQEPKRLMLLEQADHRFLDESCRAFAIRASVDWFDQMGV
jgi:uncharacterized protein